MAEAYHYTKENSVITPDTLDYLQGLPPFHNTPELKGNTKRVVLRVERLSEPLKTGVDREEAISRAQESFKHNSSGIVEELKRHSGVSYDTTWLAHAIDITAPAEVILELDRRYDVESIHLHGLIEKREVKKKSTR